MPDYIRPNMYFFYNGTQNITAITNETGFSTQHEFYPSIINFARNFTIIDFRSDGTLVYEDERWIFLNGTLYSHVTCLTMMNILMNKYGEWFVLEVNNNTLIGVLAGLIGIVPQNLSIIVEETDTGFNTTYDGHDQFGFLKGWIFFANNGLVLEVNMYIKYGTIAPSPPENVTTKITKEYTVKMRLEDTNAFGGEEGENIIWNVGGAYRILLAVVLVVVVIVAAIIIRKRKVVEWRKK